MRFPADVVECNLPNRKLVPEDIQALIDEGTISDADRTYSKVYIIEGPRRKLMGLR